MLASVMILGLQSAIAAPTTIQTFTSHTSSQVEAVWSPEASQYFIFYSDRVAGAIRMAKVSRTGALLALTSVAQHPASENTSPHDIAVARDPATGRIAIAWLTGGFGCQDHGGNRSVFIAEVDHTGQQRLGASKVTTDCVPRSQIAAGYAGGRLLVATSTKVRDGVPVSGPFGEMAMSDWEIFGASIDMVDPTPVPFERFSHTLPPVPLANQTGASVPNIVSTADGRAVVFGLTHDGNADTPPYFQLHGCETVCSDAQFVSGLDGGVSFYVGTYAQLKSKNGLYVLMGSALPDFQTSVAALVDVESGAVVDGIPLGPVARYPLNSRAALDGNRLFVTGFAGQNVIASEAFSSVTTQLDSQIGLKDLAIEAGPSGELLFAWVTVNTLTGCTATTFCGVRFLVTPAAPLGAPGRIFRNGASFF